MPGFKDSVSVVENGIRNLREVYALFKERNGECKIGLSKFAELRPKNVVLANASGTHNVCVCIKHQNVKLMIQAINLKPRQNNEFYEL